MVVLPIAGACAPAAPPAAAPPVAPKFKGEIIIGEITDVTGPNSAGNIELDKGWDGLVRYWNEERGGVAGYKVVTKRTDCQYDVDKVIALYTELVERTKAPMILQWVTAAMPRIKPLAIRDKQILFNPPNPEAAYIDPTMGPENYCFTFWPTYPDIFASFVSWAVEVDWPKRGIDRKPRFGGFADDTAMGHACAKGIRYQCEKLGVPYVADTFTKVGPTEVTSQVLILKEAKADYVIGMQTSTACAVFPKDAKRLDYHPTICFHTPIHTPALVESGLATGAYTYLPSGGIDSPGYKKMMEYYNKYDPGATKALYNWAWAALPPMFTATERAIEKVGIDKLTGEVIKRELESIKDEDLTDGLCYPYTYTPDDHRGAKGLKFIKMLDTKGNLEYTDWVPLPDWGPETKNPAWYYE